EPDHTSPLLKHRHKAGFIVYIHPHHYFRCSHDLHGNSFKHLFHLKHYRRWRIDIHLLNITHLKSGIYCKYAAISRIERIIRSNQCSLLNFEPLLLRFQNVKISHLAPIIEILSVTRITYHTAELIGIIGRIRSKISQEWDERISIESIWVCFIYQYSVIKYN